TRPLLASFLTQKVLETKAIQSLSRFIRARPARSRKFLVNGRSRFPFRVRLQQLAGIKARLVKPEKFMWPVWAHSLIDNGVKTGECGSAISFFFQASPFLKSAWLRQCAGASLSDASLS